MPAEAFDIGRTPVIEAVDPTVAGTVKIFLTTKGIGVVPVEVVVDNVAGVVPVETVLAAGVGIVNATTDAYDV